MIKTHHVVERDQNAVLVKGLGITEGGGAYGRIGKIDEYEGFSILHFKYMPFLFKRQSKRTKNGHFRVAFSSTAEAVLAINRQLKKSKKAEEEIESGSAPAQEGLDYTMTKDSTTFSVGYSSGYSSINIYPITTKGLVLARIITMLPPKGVGICHRVNSNYMSSRNGAPYLCSNKSYGKAIEMLS